MRPSRGMGDINPKKEPRASKKKIKRKDKPKFVPNYKKGKDIKQL